MKRMIAAAALATAVLTGPTWAQDEPTMEEALSMIELAASRELTKVGLGDVDLMSLDLNQLSLIRAVAGSSDYNANEKASQIRAIVANN